MVFTLRPSAHLRCLATTAGLGTISRSSSIVRFVQGGVVKTFRCVTKLTHFVDLSPHTYSTVAQRDIVLNVGWLCGSEPYETGVTSEAFRDGLAELVARPVILHRGVQMCNLANCTDRQTGNGQIRVLGNDGVWYSAPTLVHHYITHHDYLPPDAFISAVLHGVAVSIEPDRLRFWSK